MIKKCLFVIFVALFLTLNLSFSQAANNVTTNPSFNLDEIINGANGFFRNSITGTGDGFIDLSGLFEDIIDVIFTIGNLIIFCAIALMGLRYVWSGVEAKASIKESAMNMSVGVIFFYMAQALWEFFSAVIIGIVINQNTFTDMAGDIWQNVAFVVRILALIGLAAVGLKYMFTSADTRADIKRQLLPVLIGLILIFTLTQVIELVTGTASDLIGANNNSVDAPGIINGGNVDATVKKTMQNIFATAEILFQILAVMAMVFAGIRYMMANADTKADIKMQTAILILGAIFVFAGIEIIKIVQEGGNEILSGMVEIGRWI